MSAPARRVLVVDDEPEVADIVAELLSHAGYATEVVLDGAAALEAVRARRPDVVLLDFSLQGLTTSQDVVKAIGSTIPIIVMTGDVDTARARMRHEPFAFVAKPADLPRIRHVVKAAIAGTPGKA